MPASTPYAIISAITTATSPAIIIINPTDPSDPEIVDYHYLGPGFNVSMLALNLILAAIAIPLNLAVMSFYRSKLKETIPFIYFTLSTSDLLTGISGSLHSIIFFGLLVVGPADSPALFYIAIFAYFITIVSFRVSAFVSLIFAVIRTLGITYPLHFKVKRVAVIVAILVQCLFWVAVLITETLLVIANNDGTWDFSSRRLSDFFVGYFYSPSNLKFVDHLYGDSLGGVDEETRLHVECGLSLLYTGVSVSFLALLAFVAMIIQVFHLVGDSMIKTGLDKRWQSAVTIILITLVFVVCSICVLFQPLFIDCSDVVTMATTSKVKFMLQYTFGYLPFFLNAALNPLIVFARVKDVRSYVLRRALPCLAGSMSHRFS